ncbi:MAG: hypothetical protein HZC43_00200 [Nitrosomonadales bacterium]|nr:hypothetical protein [Nitrosomonadales bacterium]
MASFINKGGIFAMPVSRIASPLIPAFRSASRAIAGLAAVFLCLFLSSGHLHAAPLAVTVALSENDGPYLEFSGALHDLLLRKNVDLVVMDDPAKPVAHRGLVIAVGMKAATTVAGGNAPAVLNVLIPKAGHEKLLRDFPQRANSRTYSAIFLDQPAERMVRLIEALLPGRRHVGALIDSFPPDELAQLRQRMTRHGMTLHERVAGSGISLVNALQEVLQDSELLLALPDGAIYNSQTIRNILLASYRSGDPVIGFSPGYVKAGALGALFSTPPQIAAQAALAIQQFGETRTLPPAQHPQLFEVSVNEQVARSLGLAVKSTEELHQEISAIEGDAP